jgi:hypothetical protein
MRINSQEILIVLAETLTSVHRIASKFVLVSDTPVLEQLCQMCNRGSTPLASLSRPPTQNGETTEPKVNVKLQESMNSNSTNLTSL